MALTIDILFGADTSVSSILKDTLQTFNEIYKTKFDNLVFDKYYGNDVYCLKFIDSFTTNVFYYKFSSDVLRLTRIKSVRVFFDTILLFPNDREEVFKTIKEYKQKRESLELLEYWKSIPNINKECEEDISFLIPKTQTDL